MSFTNTNVAKFRRDVLSHWKKHGRHTLPWRKTNNPYKVLVSEVMLQQTQVPRVVEKYKEFMTVFPTVRVLAKASLGNVLKVWSGMGYNRRAKFLRDAAKVIAEKYKGRVPHEYAELRTLPGVGDYTARAIRVFAFDEPDILFETNIRAAFIRHFSMSQSLIGRAKSGIWDADIIPVAQKTSKGQDPRKWHWALMDYGAHLKRSGVRNNAQSALYAKQSKFEGSLRQVRGAIVRAITRGESMNDLRSRSSELFDKALASLARDGLIMKQKGKWQIA